MGTRVGRYEVRRLLRGNVYVARDHALDREIALEVGISRRVHHAALNVILQILPHAGKVSVYLNVEPQQVIGRPNSRQQQELRRTDRTGTEDDFVLHAHGVQCTVHREFNANAPTTLDAQPVHRRPADDMQVGTV